MTFKENILREIIIKKAFALQDYFEDSITQAINEECSKLILKDTDIDRLNKLVEFRNKIMVDVDKFLEIDIGNFIDEFEKLDINFNYKKLREFGIDYISESLRNII